MSAVNETIHAEPVMDPLPPHFEAARHYTRWLSVGAGAALALAVIAFVAQLFGYDTPAPLIAYALPLATVLYATGRMTRLRDDARQSREAGDGRLVTMAQTRLEGFGREGIAVAFSVGGAAGLGASVMVARGGIEATPGGTLTVLLGLAFGGVAFLSLVASRASTAIPRRFLPEAPGLADWLRGLQWLALLTGVGLLARTVPLLSLDWGRWLAFVLLALSALCALELWIRGAWHALRTRSGWIEGEVPVRLVTLATVFHGRGPLHGVLDISEGHLGLSLRSTWAIGFVRRSLGLLVAGLACLLWTSTALVVVRPEEQGLRLRFGRLASAVPVDPGLHLKRPWPFETVERYTVRRAQLLSLGYAGPPKDSLLWGRAHAGEEYQLLLGDGRELVSVDATVTYRIRDVRAFALAFQNPREALDALAYRLLLRATVATDLDHLLTADRAPFARRFTADLQRASDAEGLGVEILHVGFVSLHPPVGIAEAYEDVVSAEIERETRAARARVDRETALPAAEADAARETREAEGESARRLADARGAAAGFLAARSAARAAPELFRFRRRLEAVEAALADRSLFVVDHRLQSGSGAFWIDLRAAGPDTAKTEKR